MVSSWPPRACGIATFAEEVVEHGLKPNIPNLQLHVISHKDGKPQNRELVHPILDTSQKCWWESIADKVREIKPYVVHLQHEYGLYDDGNGALPLNTGFLHLMTTLRREGYPTIVETHTVHERPNQRELDFLRELIDYTTILILKEPFLRDRLEWEFNLQDDTMPTNIGVIRHGAVEGYANRFNRNQVLDELGLEDLKGRSIVELIGWIQKNKRWDLVLKRWEDILSSIEEQGGKKDEWVLLAAGDLRDPKGHRKAHDEYMALLKPLEERGLARFYRFIPRNSEYYEVMSIADLVILPSVDETQSGTLARIIALNKPYVTFNLEGLGLQTVESGGGLLATDRENLIDRIADLAANPKLRRDCSRRQANYLRTRVGWKSVVGRLYREAYQTARESVDNHKKVRILEGHPLYAGHF